MNVLGDLLCFKKVDHFKKWVEEKILSTRNIMAKNIARHMNVTIKIGKFIFVHAGCSQKY